MERKGVRGRCVSRCVCDHFGLGKSSVTRVLSGIDSIRSLLLGKNVVLVPKSRS
jgi:hypothetical protein